MNFLTILKSNEKTVITNYKFSYDIIDVIEDSVTGTINFDVVLKYFINFISSMDGSEGKSTLFENNKTVNVENTDVFILPEDTEVDNSLIDKVTKLNILKESLDTIITSCSGIPLIIIDECCTKQLSLFLELMFSKKTSGNYTYYMDKVKVLIIGRALNIHKRKFSLANYCTLTKEDYVITIKNMQLDSILNNTNHVIDIICTEDSTGGYFLLQRCVDTNIVSLGGNGGLSHFFDNVSGNMVDSELHFAVIFDYVGIGFMYNIIMNLSCQENIHLVPISSYEGFVLLCEHEVVDVMDSNIYGKEEFLFEEVKTLFKSKSVTYSKGSIGVVDYLIETCEKSELLFNLGIYDFSFRPNLGLPPKIINNYQSFYEYVRFIGEQKNCSD